jgi:hypothetical protein
MTKVGMSKVGMTKVGMSKVACRAAGPVGGRRREGLLAILHLRKTILSW